MVDHAGKAPSLPRVQWHVDVFRHRHVATNTVRADALADLIRHATVLRLVTLLASLGKQGGITVLVAVGVVTRRAGHLGLLKTRALFQSYQLVAGVDAADFVRDMQLFVKIGDVITGSEAEGRLSQLKGSGVTLAANIQLLLSRQFAWIGNEL